jgi:two-component sensor histidine kinase
MATVAGVGGEPEDVRCGGFPAWPLPLDATGAAVARSLVRSVFKALGMPTEMTSDMAVAISELATNVYLHALRGAGSGDSRATGAPEMWAYLRWRTRPEVVLKVFDTAPWHGPVSRGSDGQGPPRPAPEAEGGRGLEVVHALTATYGGHWGVHRTRSRLGAEPYRERPSS